MSNRLLAQLPIEERNQIYTVTDHLTSYLHEYFRPYSLFNPVRFAATALTSAAENPMLPINILENIVKVPLWIFTIDSVIDEKLLPEHVVREKLALYEKIVLGELQEVEPQDQYGKILLEVTNSIRTRPLFPELKELWEESYIKMINGMMFEAYESSSDVSLDDYLRHGLYSVGVPMYVISTWILQQSDTSLPNRKQMEEMMRLSGIALRLANDLRTYEKEKQENNLNAIFIKEREMLLKGMEEREAQSLAFQQINTLLQKYLDQFYSMYDDQIPLMKALYRVTRFSVDFYYENDFHLVSHEQIRSI